MTEKERRAAVVLGKCALAAIMIDICNADAADYRAAQARGLVAVGYFRSAWLRAQNTIARDEVLRSVQRAFVKS